MDPNSPDSAEYRLEHRVTVTLTVTVTVTSVTVTVTVTGVTVTTMPRCTMPAVPVTVQCHGAGRVGHGVDISVNATVPAVSVTVCQCHGAGRVGHRVRWQGSSRFDRE